LISTATNWYELNRETLTNWNTVGQPNNTQLKTSIIERFDTAAQRTSYYNQYLNLKQASHQFVDDYANQFIKLRMKVDQNNAIPVEQVIFKFVQGLKPQIMSLIYARDSQTLDAAISTARNVEIGLVIANENKQVYALED